MYNNFSTSYYVYYFQYAAASGKECGARNLAEIVHNVESNKMARILDACCGNGLLAIQVGRS